MSQACMSIEPDVPISTDHSSIVGGGAPCASNAAHHDAYTGTSVSSTRPSKSNTTASNLGAHDTSVGSRSMGSMGLASDTPPSAARI